MLYVGRLTHDSGLFKAINAGRFGLKNPHIGLIVLGDGPARQEFEKRTEFFGIKKQIIFETKSKDVASYMKSANVLIVTDTDDESEDVVLRGAAVGIPMVMARTPIREDIFVDGESALLCDPENIDEFSLKLNLLMNDIPLRKHMSSMSQNMIKAKFQEKMKMLAEKRMKREAERKAQREVKRLMVAKRREEARLKREAERKLRKEALVVAKAKAKAEREILLQNKAIAKAERLAKQEAEKLAKLEAKVKKDVKILEQINKDASVLEQEIIDSTAVKAEEQAENKPNTN
jgi:glycosyltransferase involved in cell wall biosynthesis